MFVSDPWRWLIALPQNANLAVIGNSSGQANLCTSVEFLAKLEFVLGKGET